MCSVSFPLYRMGPARWQWCFPETHQCPYTSLLSCWTHPVQTVYVCIHSHAVARISNYLTYSYTDTVLLCLRAGGFSWLTFYPTARMYVLVYIRGLVTRSYPFSARIILLRVDVCTCWMARWLSCALHVTCLFNLMAAFLLISGWSSSIWTNP